MGSLFHVASRISNPIWYNGVIAVLWVFQKSWGFTTFANLLLKTIVTERSRCKCTERVQSKTGYLASHLWLQSSYGLNVNNSSLKMKYTTLRNAEPLSYETLISVHMCSWKIVLQVVVHSKLDLLASLQYLLSRDVILIFFPTDDE